MSIFAKKVDGRGEGEPARPIEPISTAAKPAPTSSARGYGIAEAIQLMRSLPIDQNVDLVVRVIRATLASLNVRVQDIIDDATRKEKSTQDGIAALHAKVADLEKELETRRAEITALEADLKETTSVKERLQLADKIAGYSPPLGSATPPLGSATLPAPAPRLSIQKSHSHEDPSS
jgi:hypothetical protein